MRVELEIAGRTRVITIERANDRMALTIDGRPFDVEAVPLGSGRWSIRLPASGRQHEVIVTAARDGAELDVAVGGMRVPVRRRLGRARAGAAGADGNGPQRIAAPMPGKIVRVLVSPGERVEPRQGVIVIEAMKMENELRAARAGVVREVLAKEGASVEAGTPLVVIE